MTTALRASPGMAAPRPEQEADLVQVPYRQPRKDRGIAPPRLPVQGAAWKLPSPTSALTTTARRTQKPAGAAPTSAAWPPDVQPINRRTHVLKFLASTVGIIFLIGLLVVIGLLMLIF